MSDEILDDPVQEPVVPPKKTTPADPQQVDWEARYKGLQRTYDRLTKDHDALKAKYDELTDDAENVRQASRKGSDEIETLKKSYQALETDKKAIETELAVHRAQVDRTKTIMAEFSDLAPFEAQGLLPSATSPVELKTKLEAFRKAIQDSADKTAINKLQGYTPPSSGGNTPPTSPSKEQVFAELQRLAGRRNAEQQARYEELMSIWDELNK